MASDVDRLKDIEGDYERRMRGWRDAPERGFGAVLEDAPAHGELEEEERPDPRRRPKRPPQAPAEVEMAAAATAAPPTEPTAEPTPKTAEPKKLPPKGPRVPPDPRAAALHRQLQAKAGKKP